jgi:D-3-phosphoglycerate dehydrogenase
MSAPYRVALSGDFRKADGSPVFPDFDLEPLRSARDVEFAYLEPVNPIRADQLADFDALILLAHRFTQESIHPNGRLAVVARFGVGYDTVDVEACTKAGIALVITPDGVRRPVGVSIVTLMLALTGKLMIKDRLTREGPAGFARRGEHMGVGLVGRTFGSIGIGNIGAELFRLLQPFGMKLIAHDPYADRKIAAELDVQLVGLEEVFRRADIVNVSCPLSPETHHLVNAERLALMKPTAYLLNTARGPIVDQKALTEVLKARRIAGAGLDVLEQEPPDPEGSDSEARQCHSGATRSLLDRPMLRREWGGRCARRARCAVWPRAAPRGQQGRAGDGPLADADCRVPVALRRMNA